MNNPALKNALSLVELSISMTIIALTTVVVIGGGAMIESSKTSKLAREIQLVEKSTRTFRSIYNALPGDFLTAQDHFGSTGVANGDGNGIIVKGSNDTSDEVHNAMVHLAKADLINTTSLANNGTKFLALTSFKGDLFLSSNKQSDGTTISGFTYTSGTHNFIIASASGYSYDGFITPEVAYNIDKKFDDSFPRTGNLTYIVAGNVTDASCTNSTTKYYLTSTSLACNLSFQID